MTVKRKYGGRKVRDGTVVSDKMQKTLLVAVEEHIRHPLYKKRVRRLHRFMAHDEREEGKMGDRVRIVEAAPISRRKRWQLVEILERAELPEVAAESIDLDLLGEVKREEEEAPEAAPVATSAAVAAEEPAAEEPATLELQAEEVAVEEVAKEADPAAVEAPEAEAEVVTEEPEAAAEPEPTAPAEEEPLAEPEPESPELEAAGGEESSDQPDAEEAEE